MYHEFRGLDVNTMANYNMKKLEKKEEKEKKEKKEKKEMRKVKSEKPKIFQKIIKKFMWFDIFALSLSQIFWSKPVQYLKSSKI